MMLPPSTMLFDCWPSAALPKLGSGRTGFLHPYLFYPVVYPMSAYAAWSLIDGWGPQISTRRTGTKTGPEGS